MGFSVVKSLVRLTAVIFVAAGLGLLATAVAGTREDAAPPSGRFTVAECRSMEGAVTNAGDGQWACCFREIGQCWYPETPRASGPGYTCRGDGCPSDAKIAKLYRRLSQAHRDSVN